MRRKKDRVGFEPTTSAAGSLYYRPIALNGKKLVQIPPVHLLLRGKYGIELGSFSVVVGQKPSNSLDKSNRKRCDKMFETLTLHPPTLTLYRLSGST
jgi:hypothetical protein